MSRTICDLHDEITKLANEIATLNHESPHFQRSLDSRVRKIREAAKEAKQYGQKMEGRLQKYYDAIAGLGFLRTK